MGSTQSSIAVPSNLTTDEVLKENLETHPKLKGFVLDKAMDSCCGRFSKKLRVRHSVAHSTAVVQCLWVSSSSSSSNTNTKDEEEDDLYRHHREELGRIKTVLKGVPHVAPFTAWCIGNESSSSSNSNNHSNNSNVLSWRPVFMVRPHFYTTLSDRLASRPWLDGVETVGIAAQLWSALDHIHSRRVIHGSLTTDNVGLTAYGWVVLMDLSTTTHHVALPDDDPSNYRFYFESTRGERGEKPCYLAPERFYTPTTNDASSSNANQPPPDSTIPTAASDIFSAGCVLVEVFLNGQACMELGDLMEYRRFQNLTPTLEQKLQKIESSHMRATCRNMLHWNPAQRLTAAEYSDRLVATEHWPASMTLFTNLAQRLTTCQTPDAQLAILVSQYHHVLWETHGVPCDDKEYAQRVLGPTACRLENLSQTKETRVSDVSLGDRKESELLQETEALLAQLEEISLTDTGVTETKPFEKENQPAEPKSVAKEERSSTAQGSLLIYLQMILALVRSVQRPTSKLVALRLIALVARHVNDGTRLQRIVPVLVSLLDDQDSLVRSLAIATLTDTLEIVESFPPSDAKLFPEYIFKRVAPLITDSSLSVRVAFAECLAKMATTAQRFLDICHAVRLYEVMDTSNGAEADQDHNNNANKVFDDDATKLLDEENGSESSGGLPSSGKILIHSSYDAELGILQEIVSRWVVQIATDQSDFSSFPKRALLQDLQSLCLFFGVEGVMAFILPQILAFLNDRKDWELRAILFRQLPSLCSTIGRGATEEFVLPCVEIGLVDSQEGVVGEALACLHRLVDIGLMSRTALLGGTPSKQSDQSSLVRRYSPLLVHPSASVRYQAVQAYAAIARAISDADSYVYLAPVLLPFLRYQPTYEEMTSASGLQSCLVEPWSRDAFQSELQNIQQGYSSQEVWTTVEDDFNTRRRPVDDTSSVSDAKAEDPKVQARHLVFAYIKMLWRHNVQTSASRRFSPDLAHGIEGPAKLTQSVMFPRQRSIGAKGKYVPEWFASLQNKVGASNKAGAAESAAITSVSQLGQVYGISILGPLNENTSVDGLEDSNSNSTDETIAANVLDSEDTALVQGSHFGEWGADALLNPASVDTSMLVAKLRGIGVPPLPPRLGDQSGMNLLPRPAEGKSSKKDWRPKMSAMVASSSTVDGHTASVSRIAVSLDSRFFATASHDGTCRVWETKKAEESVGVLRSSYTYFEHSRAAPSRVNDIAMIEGSHSIVSGDSNGNVHVWRVDTNVSSQAGQGEILGLSSLREANIAEGEILAVSHFESPAASTFVYATQKGRVHAWDLRSAQEPFVLEHCPRLGLMSSISLGHDRQYLVTGTSRGYMGLWDIRFNRAVKLWRHNQASSINRLATSFVSPPSSWAMPSSRTSHPRPFLFAACGQGEVGMYDMTDGTCRQCFRSMPTERKWPQDLPPLWDIPMSRSTGGILASGRREVPREGRSVSPRVNSMVGSIGASNQSFLITGSSDSKIRFWDFSDPSKCFSVGATVPSYSRATFERRDFSSGSSRLILCSEARSQAGVTSETRRVSQGLKRPDEHHTDSINDVKLIDGNLMLTCSRDSNVKIWR